MKLNSLLGLSLFSGGLIILFKFFEWQLTAVLTPFLMPVLWLILYGYFVVVSIVTLINLFRKKDWKPLLVLIVTVLLVFNIPFSKIAVKTDYLMKKSERETVVAKVDKGYFKPNVPHNSSLIHLPDKYKDLSTGGGDIIIDKQGDDIAVFFFTFRGILDNFSGFAYSPDGKKPNRRSFGGDFKEIVKMSENWYFVSSW